MENSGTSSFLRTRRLESCFNASSSLSVKETPKRSAKEELRSKRRADIYLDEDGWGSVLISWIRIVMCFLTMMVTTFVWASIMLVLIPWPYERIRQGNIYGHVTGRLMMWILGNPIKIEGAEFSNKRAIYISNHASPLDIFLIMWLTPTGTVGIAKKEDQFFLDSGSSPPNADWKWFYFLVAYESIPAVRNGFVPSIYAQIIWYPLFGQLYVLANHLRIDRSNPTAAIESMKEAAHAVVKNNLSLIIFPEGTRSKNGRLLRFKKGFIHLALQSRLPIVPMVLTGTHLAWRKGSLHIRPAPLNVKYLPPISTTDWTADKMEDYIKMIHDLYAKHLPESQRPLEL